MAAKDVVLIRGDLAFIILYEQIDQSNSNSRETDGRPLGTLPTRSFVPGTLFPKDEPDEDSVTPACERL